MPVWLFPFILPVYAVFEETIESSRLGLWTFSLVFFVLFFWSFMRAYRPFLKNSVPMRYWFLLVWGSWIPIGALTLSVLRFVDGMKG